MCINAETTMRFKRTRTKFNNLKMCSGFKSHTFRLTLPVLPRVSISGLSLLSVIRSLFRAFGCPPACAHAHHHHLHPPGPPPPPQSHGRTCRPRHPWPAGPGSPPPPPAQPQQHPVLHGCLLLPRQQQQPEAAVWQKAQGWRAATAGPARRAAAGPRSGSCLGRHPAAEGRGGRSCAGGVGREGEGVLEGGGAA